MADGPDRLPPRVTWQQRPFPDANLLLLPGRNPAPAGQRRIFAYALMIRGGIPTAQIERYCTARPGSPTPRGYSTGFPMHSPPNWSSRCCAAVPSSFGKAASTPMPSTRPSRVPSGGVQVVVEAGQLYRFAVTTGVLTPGLRTSRLGLRSCWIAHSGHLAPYCRVSSLSWTSR
jgi:hypothetical protein